MIQLLLVLAIIAVILGFCVPRGGDEAPAQQGRPETEYLEKVEPVYGQAGVVRKKLDQAIETNEQRPQQLDQMMEQQMSGANAPPPE